MAGVLGDASDDSMEQFYGFENTEEDFEAEEEEDIRKAEETLDQMEDV